MNPKPFYIIVHITEVIMHNITSRNQLDEWRHFEDTIDEWTLENQKLNDYYECLIECDLTNQNTCKRICKEFLMT